ncbi:MAG: phosphoenolpyruvate--protein phosphotransferase [Gemmatimonadaceae bacterium]
MPASPGIVVGPVHLLRWEVPDVPHTILPDEAIEPEIERFRAVLERARERLEFVRDRAERRAGPEEAQIFEMQQLLLDDPEMRKHVEALIRHSINAEQAFHQHMSDWRHSFARHAAPELRERAGDILDVEIRVLSLLLGLPDHDPVDVPKGTNAVLVTHDLTPSLTVQLDRDAIAAIATDAGTRTSHIAILARSLGIPAVVGLRDATERLRGDEIVILDGTVGTLNVNPTAAEIEQYRERARREAARDHELASQAMTEAVTIDGVRLLLRANVDLPEEAELAAHSGADGVGLMRTEFLVLGRAGMPDEDEQYEAYRRVVESFAGHAVVIRTFDIGGDKLPVGGFPHEANPFLGWRAIRMCLDQPELFKVQLRALLRAAMHGDVRILLPLIVSVDEVHATRDLLREAAAELAARGVPHRTQVPLGAMIETPAAAVLAVSMAKEVDFFSIGSNDLVQYTLAVDRGNANLAARFTPLHPAVLRLIKHTVDVGHAQAIDVCVCGEMASVPLTAFALIGLGVRELSVSPRAVPRMKRLVRQMNVATAAAAAAQALDSATAAAAEAILVAYIGSEGE